MNNKELNNNASQETENTQPQTQEEAKTEETAKVDEPQGQMEAFNEEPKAEAAPVEEPKAEKAPKEIAEEPKAETPAEEPKTEAIQEEPKAEAAPAEEPKTEAKEEAPKVESTEEPKAEAPKEETKAEEAPSEEAPAEEKKEETSEDDAKSQRQKYFEELYSEMEGYHQAKSVVEVTVKARIRGGLRVHYKDLQMFLPASHFTLKRTPTEEELHEAVGKAINVQIHEIQEYDEGRKAVIVSRKNLLMNEFWGSINEGDIVEGKVSSVANFGVFVDLGGVEGLVHISRLSQVHVKDPNDLYKKGDDIKVVVVELDKEKNRIALSRKELEESPWKNVEQDFAPGTRCKGIVRRLTEFGAYVELKPGVDGLLRNAELSWTKRIKKPSEILSPDQEIEIEVLAVSEDKHTVSLSYKKTQPNPWPEIPAKYPVGTEIEGLVAQVMPQGAIVSISDEIDGFMPRSKMRGMLRGKKIPFQPGDKVEVIIADLNPDEESLILTPKVDEDSVQEERPRRERPRGGGKKIDPANNAEGNTSFSMGDLLSEKAKEKLMNSMDDE
jgi:small subunit ribosomal protein S1